MFLECGLKFYLDNDTEFQYLIKCFRAIPFVPVELVETAFIALINSPLYKELEPEVYFKKGGKTETLEIFREKLKTFTLYYRVSNTHFQNE